MGQDEQRDAGQWSAAAPRLGDVIGAAPRNDRADPADPFVEDGRADGRHLEPGVVAAGRVTVAEPAEESVAADPNGCSGRSSAPAMQPSREVEWAVTTLVMSSPSQGSAAPTAASWRYNEPAGTNSSLAHPNGGLGGLKRFRLRRGRHQSWPWSCPELVTFSRPTLITATGHIAKGSEYANSECPDPLDATLGCGAHLLRRGRQLLYARSG